MNEQMTLKQLVGDNVRSLRKARGFSQEQLGEFAGLSYKFLGEVERGAVNPSLESLEKIAAALQVETFCLFLHRDLVVMSANDVVQVRAAMVVLNKALGCNFS